MKVYLDAGHGGVDSGAIGIDGRQEKDDAQRLTDLVANKLKGSGITVVVNTDVNQTLQSVVNQSNSENVDLFISIHRNAFDDPKSNGLEVYTCQNPREVTNANANIVYERLLRVAQMTSRGVKEANFYVLKYTNAPAMLLEIGFVTNKNDNALFDQNIEGYANAIADGINKIFGLSNISKTKYQIILGDFASKDEAIKVMQIIKNVGIIGEIKEIS